MNRPSASAWYCLRALIGLAGLVLLASCASTPPERPATPTPAESLLAPLARQHHVCAAALALVRQGQLQSITTASGCEGAPPVGPDSVFQAASLSKPVFAYAVLKLVQQGRLVLDAPVLQYLPQGYRHAHDPLHPEQAGRSDEVTDPRLGQVTVRMLLQHTAGLPNWARGPLRFEGLPGERWSYSGEGYMLLQRAVEHVMQQALDEAMQALVFAPLGLDHSGYRWTPSLGEALLPGHRVDGVVRQQVRMNQPVAAYSLYTTAGDYARFVRAWLQDPALQALASASPVEVDARLRLAWGLGWGLETSDQGTGFWQWGSNPGYRAFVLALPAAGDGLVLLTNSDSGLKLVGPLVRSALPGEHDVLHSPFLSAGLLDTLCERLRVCH